MAVLLFALLIRLPSNAGDVNQDLIEAAKKGDTGAVEALLAAGADVNAKTNSGFTAFTALMWTARFGNVATVQALLDAGAHVHAKDRQGGSALMYAARNGHTAIVELLKKAGAKK